jgi:error-prone DNA polymerase
LELWNIPPDDPEVYRMLQRADTVGVFQVESRAQMATLPRLKPERFYDLVVEVALIRPGPVVGQMVHPYLNRRAGREPVTYPHPALEPILKRTLGVPLFQEQILRIAMVAAGFSGGQAEELRRAFSFKRSERRMKQVEIKLWEGMAKQGITGEAAEQIVKSITSFALYGFPESHSASFALLVYASAYLRAYFPAAFTAAILNNQPMGFYRPATLVKDAQRHGVRFAPIDVERSDWPCTVEDDGAVRLGLCYVAGLRRDVGMAIAGARDQGPGASRGQGPGARSQGLAAEGTPSASPLRRAENHAAGRTAACASRPVREAGVIGPPGDPSAAGTVFGLGESRGSEGPRPGVAHRRLRCPKCGCDDPSLLEVSETGSRRSCFCNTCAHNWAEDTVPARRFRSLEDLISRTDVNRQELATLAEIGALNSFGFDRREALWQIEKAIRPMGELFADRGQEPGAGDQSDTCDLLAPSSWPLAPDVAPGLWPLAPDKCPLPSMSVTDRLVSDYEGTGLTIGPHPMAMRRQELALRGVLRAADLPRQRNGRRVRVAGAVITRQRPGTAKGFVFLTLEDETGIANIIIRPDVFAEDRLTIIQEPFLLIEGTLQNLEGVTSVRAERLEGIGGTPVEIDARSFY